MKCGIYCIRNTANGKVYVGQSTHIERRKLIHFWNLKNLLHRNNHLQNSFNKHGEDKFEFRILEETYEDMLDIRERSWIRYYQSDNPYFGYNKESGGNFQKRLSLETRQKIANMAKGRNVSKETRGKMSVSQKARTGRFCSLETRQKISQKLKGKIISPEIRKKMSEALKGNLRSRGRVLSKEHKTKISQSMKGIIKSPQTCKKISEAKKLYWRNHAKSI